MDVRRLVDSDLPQYRELMLHAYATEPAAFVSTPEERAAESDDWWTRRIADPDGQSLAFGAFKDGRLVGTAAIEFLTRSKVRHRARLIGMFVHESHRGSGAGAELVRAVLGAASARPETRIVALTVTEGNTAAIQLYERCGFRPFGVEPMAIATADGYKPKVHMWVPIGETGAS